LVGPAVVSASAFAPAVWTERAASTPAVKMVAPAELMASPLLSESVLRGDGVEQRELPG